LDVGEGLLADAVSGVLLGGNLNGGWKALLKRSGENAEYDCSLVLEERGQVEVLFLYPLKRQR